MDWRDYIHSDPKIAVGKPVVKGTRLAVEFLLDLYAAGWTEAQILENYPHLTPEALCAVHASAAGSVRAKRRTRTESGTTAWFSDHALEDHVINDMAIERRRREAPLRGTKKYPNPAKRCFVASAPGSRVIYDMVSPLVFSRFDFHAKVDRHFQCRFQPPQGASHV